MRRAEAQLIHDMRNAATVIKGAAETLHTSWSAMPAAGVDHLTAMLARRSEMLVRLLEDLAVVHALDRGDLALQLQEVRLGDALEHVVAEHRPREGGGITVEVEAGAAAIADPIRLCQVLDNLLSNAVRYGGDNVAVRGWREGDVVRIAVTDDGDGVAPELVDSLFERYTRGEASRIMGGSGLGLSIARQLCRVAGGDLDYHDATFTVTLPAVPRARGDLGEDVAPQGHPVMFWTSAEELADVVADYVTAGLVAGEAVVIAVTAEHRELVDARLAWRGIDPAAVVATGQYLPLDAAVLHAGLRVGDHVDPDRFDELIGGTVDGIRTRWRAFRAFGEIVDLYWRAGDGVLALELEACWNRLRERVDFPLYCAYELASGPAQAAICDHHDAVVA